MNKLREKFKKAFPYSPSSHFEELEQITDDFTDEFADWVIVNAYKFPRTTTTKELRQYFKENIYGK